MRWWSPLPIHSAINFAIVPLDKLVAVTAAALPGTVTDTERGKQAGAGARCDPPSRADAELVVLDP